jgi:tetratricopeptide (TPR) repeat protein
MYDQYPLHDVPQVNLIQRFFSQRWRAIALEIIMTVVITVAAGAAFDFFDPLDGAWTTSADRNSSSASVAQLEDSAAQDPLAFITETGKKYLEQGRFAAAKAMFAWAIALAPDDADGYSWRGYVNMIAGDYAEAQADYRRLLALKPADFDGHNALCWAYGETGDFAQAAAHCQQAQRSAGNSSDLVIALENWCWLQVEMGDYAAAAEDCRVALAYAPAYPEATALAHYNMGRVLFAQGKADDALPHLVEALRIGSTYSRMYLEIGAIYDTLGHHLAAQASYAIYGELVGERGVGVGQANG